MTLARRLYNARIAAGLTQPVMAERIGVSYRAYQNYESGHAVPRPVLERGILAALETVRSGANEAVLTDSAASVTV